MTADNISPTRRHVGQTLIWGSVAVLVVVALAQAAQTWAGQDFGFASWRPTLYAYLLFSICLCWAQVLLKGEQGKRILFVLPSALFVISLTVFPLLFGILIALSDWNLAAPDGRKFNGVANIVQMWHDPFYWNAMTNMVWYCLAILPEYAVAFGLALMLNANIRARKFFRVAFLLPLMLSPVAVGWMIGKSMLVLQPAGPVIRLAKTLGWENPAFFSHPLAAKM